MRTQNFNKAGYTATSCGRVGRGGNARFPTFRLDHLYGPTNQPTNRPTDRRTDKGSYRVACPQLKIPSSVYVFRDIPLAQLLSEDLLSHFHIIKVMRLGNKTKEDWRCTLKRWVQDPTKDRDVEDLLSTITALDDKDLDRIARALVHPCDFVSQPSPITQARVTYWNDEGRDRHGQVFQLCRVLKTCVIQSTYYQPTILCLK